MRSNRNKFRRVLVSFLVWASVTLVYSQEFINIRKISLTPGDTTVVAGILADVKIDKVAPDVYYYWYSHGKIYGNQGGYSGNLLHGEYIEYDIDGNLILKGRYDRGLKSGKWIYWYENGVIREVIEYEGGLLEGTISRYSDDGKILYSASYKDNLLHGDMTRVIRDTLYQITFKKGTEVKRIPLHVF